MNSRRCFMTDTARHGMTASRKAESMPMMMCQPCPRTPVSYVSGLNTFARNDARARLALQRSADLLPGVDASGEMAGGGEPRVPGGLYRHRGAFAERAIEQETLVCRDPAQ